jgi:hypothetical protein
MNSSELRITEATLAFVKGFNLAQIIYQIIYLTMTGLQGHYKAMSG